jgi:Bax protein
MRKKFSIAAGLLIIITIVLCIPYQSFEASRTHKQFVAFMLSKAAIANSLILQQRQELLNLYHQHNDKQPLSRYDRHWLISLSQEYQTSDVNFNHAAAWQALIERIDIVPNSLVVAQAINESGWGTSRFAKNGNNYFGEWCFSKGCGLVPSQRNNGANFEVRSFPDALSSVESYMLNLNSNHLYRVFRAQRLLLRTTDKPVFGLSLTNALQMYSTKRTQYVNIISDIIENNHLAAYDTVPKTNKVYRQFFDWL